MRTTWSASSSTPFSPSNRRTPMATIPTTPLTRPTPRRSSIQRSGRAAPARSRRLSPTIRSISTSGLHDGLYINLYTPSRLRFTHCRPPDRTRRRRPLSRPKTPSPSRFDSAPASPFTLYLRVPGVDNSTGVTRHQRQSAVNSRASRRLRGHSPHMALRRPHRAHPATSLPHGAYRRPTPGHGRPDARVRCNTSRLTLPTILAAPVYHFLPASSRSRPRRTLRTTPAARSSSFPCTRSAIRPTLRTSPSHNSKPARRSE